MHLLKAFLVWLLNLPESKPRKPCLRSHLQERPHHGPAIHSTHGVPTLMGWVSGDNVCWIRSSRRWIKAYQRQGATRILTYNEAQRPTPIPSDGGFSLRAGLSNMDGVTSWRHHWVKIPRIQTESSPSSFHQGTPIARWHGFRLSRPADGPWAVIAVLRGVAVMHLLKGGAEMGARE